MTPEILDFARSAFRKHPFDPGNVVEIGSYNVNGSIREVFAPTAKRYIGIDLQAGPGGVPAPGIAAFDTRWITACGRGDGRIPGTQYLTHNASGVAAGTRSG